MWYPVVECNLFVFLFRGVCLLEGGGCLYEGSLEMTIYNRWTDRQREGEGGRQGGRGRLQQTNFETTMASMP